MVPEIYQLSKMEIALILEVYEELKTLGGEIACEMLFASTFFKQLSVVGENAYCETVECWIDRIRYEWKKRNNHIEKRGNHIE